ncbi:hypothetical protein [Dethiobacter alkaliphilus]|uniref:Uncharacterized protein n=1 Tax=Dethiobacter alkaliphilus AHT 1 TaxID=555088 RepID=C0GKG9_DETAL|nr:hypothetical protein [Dethiobacter alkaliphilus]EEG76136.1 hypothetical protein DealDRAFT_2978 [Dethiobacter alkaliphilus AHT 1]
MRKFYRLKPSLLIPLIILQFIFVSMCSILYYFERDFLGLLLLLISIAIAISIIVYILSDFIEIDESGVKYVTLFKRYEMSWDDVVTVGISDIFKGRPGWSPCIYFTTDTAPVKYVMLDMIGKEFIMLGYRRSAIEEIRKYWQGDIVNVYELPLPHEKRDYTGLSLRDRLLGNRWFLRGGLILGLLWISIAVFLSTRLNNDYLLIAVIILPFALISFGSMAIYLGNWKKLYVTAMPVAIIVTVYMLLSLFFKTTFN